VDVVTVCTPSGAHEESAIKAAEAGKHVIVEKPIEVTLEKADRIIESCNRNKVLLGVIFQSRFSEGSQLLKQALEMDLFGRLTLGSAYIRWFRPQEYYDSGEWRGTLALDGGGALMNQSIHAIDLLRWFMGDVESVQAFTATLAHEKIEVEDTGAAILKFANGALGVIEGSTAAFPGYAKRIEISGERGTVVLTEDRITEWSFAEPTKLDAPAKKLYSSDSSGTGGAADPMAINFSGHKAQFENFIDALNTGNRPLVDGVEGRKTLEVVLAIYRAGAESSRIDLPLG
jgi:predicted dehydrogenase